MVLNQVFCWYGRIWKGCDREARQETGRGEYILVCADVCQSVTGCGKGRACGKEPSKLLRRGCRQCGNTLSSAFLMCVCGWCAARVESGGCT